jgi:hypothetical protein
MAPRAAARTLLGTDAELISYGLTVARWYSSSALDTVTRNQRWGVIRWLDRTRAFGLVAAFPMEVWVYQPSEMGRDYGYVDAALERVKELLVVAEQVAGADGWTLSGATWESDSADLTDEGFSALTKFSRFRVAGRPVVQV